MRLPRLSSRAAGVMTATLLAVATAGTYPAAAAGNPDVAVGSGPAGQLNQVTATSARDVWAVGCTGGSCLHPLVVHWDGRSLQVRSPGRAFYGDELSGVAAISARDVWVVGNGTRGGVTTLIAHWNGRSWKRIPSPNPPPAKYADVLTAAAAVSVRDVWAVGYASNGSTTLIEHWNGRSWRQVRSPSPGANDILWGVAAASARNVWAVGGDGGKTLIEHWNGRSWKRVPSPSPAEHSVLPGDVLYNVTVSSARSAWAVGSTRTNSDTLIEHWNGRSWKHMPSPTPSPLGGVGSVLTGVAVTTARNAWTVGTTGLGSYNHLIERRDGATWKLQRTRIPGLAAGWAVTGVAAVSARSAWAAGFTGHDQPLLLRWSGNAWQQVTSPAARQSP
jgi:hypothetical protein